MRNNVARRTCRRRAVAAAMVGTLMQLGWLGNLNDKFVGCTAYFDPCGTILANCAPGDFITNAADVGDFCVDPACTVPGQCAGEGQALGTITNICP